MIKSFVLRFVAGAIMASAPVGASAHDFFLMPAQFTSRTTGELDVRATVSASFPRLENVVAADRIGELYAQGTGNPRLRILGAGENALNLRLAAPRPGIVVAGVSARPRDVEYPEDRIGVILEEYNLGGPAAAAIERLPAPRTLRVSSRRFAKTIVCAVRCTNRSAAARRFGVDLEFVGVGSSVDHFLLLRGGRALPDHPVDLVTSDGIRSHLRTGANGQVHLPGTARGTLMLFAAVLDAPADGERFILNLSSLTLAR